MRLGFPMKPCECLRVTGNIFRQELEGDEPMHPQVLGLINDPHAPAAQLLDDAVMRDGLAYELGRGSHWREWYDAIFGGSTATRIATSRTPLWLASEWDVGVGVFRSTVITVRERRFLKGSETAGGGRG
jgi:hypothetical protein